MPAIRERRTLSRSAQRGHAVLGGRLGLWARNRRTRRWAGLWGLPLLVCGWHDHAGAAENDLYVAANYAVDPSVRGCWDEDEFRRSVAHRIGYDPFREDAPINVRIHVGGSASAVDGHVEWRKANGLLMGERRFVAKDGNCAKLLTEMSFAVGLQIELLRPNAAPAPAGPVARAPAATTSPPRTSSDGPSAATSAGATAPPPKPAPEKPEKPKAEKTDEPREEPAPPSSGSPAWRAWLGLGPSLAWRLGPGVTSEARLFFAARRNDFSLEIAAEATYPSSERRWDGSGFRQYLAGGAVAVCRHHDWLSGCALGRASAVLVNGLGVDSPRSPSGVVAHAGVRLGAALPLGGPWLLAARLDGLVLLTSSKVVLNGAQVWDMPRLAGLAGVDLIVRFR
jgi:hypothetical protein